MATPATNQQAAQAKQAAAIEAYAHIHENVYAPTFFHKLASDYGITPANEDECCELMTIATKLRGAHDAAQHKQAKDTGVARQSFLKTAHQHLDAIMQEHGLAAPQQAANNLEHEIKAAAATLTLNPSIAQAVLQLQAATV